MRTIILHYHLFKNAGSSVDAILKDNFKDRWVTKEFSGDNNTDKVIEWIETNQDSIAFSSHTMNGPIPQIDGIKTISIAMLRDPIKRIISAYKFERLQESNTWGAQLAKELSFEGYVLTRLKKTNDKQCRNFQTHRLATLHPSDQPKIRRAIAALNDLSFVGIVEDFNTSMATLSSQIVKDFPNYKYTAKHSNKSGRFDFDINPTLNQLLIECNRADQRLWKIAKENGIYLPDAKRRQAKAFGQW